MTLYDFMKKAGLFVNLPEEIVSEELKSVDIEFVPATSGPHKVSFGNNKLRVHVPMSKVA